MKLLKKKYLNYSGKVYDIKVSTPDHSYIINNAVVHNSAAGSLTAFCLDITKVDPLEYGLLFERFLNRGRIKKTCPDIDTDFEAARRDDVKRYMEDKYGHDKVCSLGAYTSLQMKAVFRDFCKLRGVPIATMEYLSNLMFELRDNKNARATKAPWEYIFKLASRSSVLYDFVQEHAEMIEETKLCHAAPRAASVHPCATLILPPGESIYTSVPIRKAEVNGAETIVSEWEGPYVEMAGYLKEDVLGIQQLDKFRMIVNLIEENYGEKVDIYNFPLDQPEVYEMFSKGLNGDVFHLGSKGLTAFCIQVGPDTIRELCAMLALFRPGPMDSNFHMEYVALKNGEKEIEYMPGLEGITKETFGLLAYQEQIMQICVQLASFTLVEADNIRKGMGKVDKKFFAEQGEKFFAGALKNGWDKEYLEGLWSKMCAFGGYAFNKCLCGDTQLLRYANNKNGKSVFHPTIAEMYKIRHDKEFAKKNGHEELYWKYKQKGYGTCWSLNENNLLIKNNIKDIYYQGVKNCYTLTTESGKQITCTDNHKFPTSNGKKQLSEINIDTDMIFVSSGWKAKDESGIETHFEKIISIEKVGQKEVYDVEMEHPYHTLTIDNGIVTSNSHALCYAVTAYICQYLKWRWPLPYWITALQFASDDNLPRFISEINKVGKILVTSPDINKSKLSFYADFDTSKIVWSISKVKQCGEVAVSFIFEEREKNGPFFDLQEFLFRCDKRKVNKSVVENLILAGAFDDLEGLSMPSQRKRLINKYREIMNVKVDKKKDWLTLAIEEGKADSEWWWILQQKRVSGLAFFNWKDLVLSWKFEEDRYLDLEEYEKEDLKVTGSRMVLTGGIVTELEHKSSKKGDYCKFRIEQNYSFAWVTVWNDHYKNYEQEFLDCVGKIVLVKARAYFDAYKNENALQSDQGFDLTVMS